MTTGAILCVAVSLTIVGIALVLKQVYRGPSIQWRNGVDMSVFMDPTAPPQQTTAIRTQLAVRVGTDIKRFTYCDQACAYNEFKHHVRQQPRLPAVGVAVDLPPSFRVVPDAPAADRAGRQQVLGRSRGSRASTTPKTPSRAS